LLADLPAGVTQLPAEAYRDAILAACASANDVILVAASMSGIFLPLAAESQRVSKVVYEAGMIPPLGISPMQMVRSDMSMFNPAWVGKDPTRDVAVAREFLFRDCLVAPVIMELVCKRADGGHGLGQGLKPAVSSEQVVGNSETIGLALSW